MRVMYLTKSTCNILSEVGITPSNITMESISKVLSPSTIKKLFINADSDHYSTVFSCYPDVIVRDTEVAQSKLLYTGLLDCVLINTTDSSKVLVLYETLDTKSTNVSITNLLSVMRCISECLVPSKIIKTATFRKLIFLLRHANSMLQ